MGIYSNMAAQLVMPIDESPVGLLDFSVRAQSADTAMFESMLELDFVDYYAESGQIALSETETMGAKSSVIKNLFHKIAELFQKAWNTLKQFADSLAVRVQEFFKINEKLVAKYEKDGKIDLAAAQKADKDKKIVISLYFDSQGATEIPEQKNINEKIGRAFATMNAADLTIEKAKSTKEELDSAIKNFTSSESFNKLFKDSTIGAAGPGTLDSAREFLLKGYKAVINQMLGDTKTKMNEYKTARSEAMKAAAKSKGEDREAATAKFSLASSIVSGYSKYINYCSRVAIQSVAAARKTYIAFAVAAHKTATTESVNYDDVLELALEFATDNFVEETTFA